VTAGREVRATRREALLAVWDELPANPAPVEESAAAEEQNHEEDDEECIGIHALILGLTTGTVCTVVNTRFAQVVVPQHHRRP
jgi:hypothetical protein